MTVSLGLSSTSSTFRTFDAAQHICRTVSAACSLVYPCLPAVHLATLVGDIQRHQGVKFIDTGGEAGIYDICQLTSMDDIGN